MFNSDEDDEDISKTFTYYNHQDKGRHSWLEVMGVSGFLYLAAGVVLIVIIIACCCGRKRSRGQVLTNPASASVPPVPPAPNTVPAHYPQQQYSPYPVQQQGAVTSYPVQSAPYHSPFPSVTPYPASSPAPYPPATPYPPAAPYPPAVPAAYPAAAPYPIAPSAPDHNVLPPSYEQAVGDKNPPYNPHH